MSTLETRITQEQKDDLYHRRITTRELAKRLGVSECYLSRKYPGRIPVETRAEASQKKRMLREVRKKHRLAMIERAKRGEFTMEEAARRCHTTARTLFRLQNEK